VLLRSVYLTVPVYLFLQTAVFAQTPAPPRNGRNFVRALPEPPVPDDPLELVTGAAQPLENAEQRQAAVNLLASAQALSNVRAQPYDLKTTFTVSGSGGAWSLEDTSPSRNVYRWTAQGPGYSAVNLYTNQMLYSNQAPGAIPLRLAQVRAAIFFVHGQIGPKASIRTFNGVLNGADVSCILLFRGMHARMEAGPRRWEEQEYCVDPKSSLLMTYSPTPGVYILYDYSEPLHFHSKIIPGKFTITQGGQGIVQARLESVADTANLPPSLFETAGLNQVGVGAAMTPPWHVRSVRHDNTSGVVALHGMLSPQGVLSDTEILASSDAGLNPSALNMAAEWQNWRAGDEDEPGGTPQSHEVFFMVQFVNH
jgi:hypothetical protein